MLLEPPYSTPVLLGPLPVIALSSYLADVRLELSMPDSASSDTAAGLLS